MRNSALLLVKGVRIDTCSITFMGRTRLRELTRPRKARTDFLLSGNLKSFTFCTLRGSAITKSWLTYQPKNSIFDFAKSHFGTFILEP